MSETGDASKTQIMNTDINTEGNVIRYCLMPTLQHISAVTIIRRLWLQSDIQYTVVELCNQSEYYIDLKGTSVPDICIKIGDKVLDGVSQLPVPNRITEILSNIVEPIGLEIFKWAVNNEKYIFSDGHNGQLYKKPTAINYMDILVWTARGRIDYQATAKKLIEAKKLSDNDLYNIACIYCLEDKIDTMSAKVIDTLVLESHEKHAMVCFWTSHITGDFTELDKVVASYNTENGTDRSANECIFEALMDDIRNQVAIKHIWDKLSDEEKSRQIGTAMTQASDPDIKCYLLSQMSEEQQKEVFKSNACFVLLSLLDDWLWGEFFLPTIHNIWSVISGGHFLIVLETIVEEMNKIHRNIAKYDHFRSTFKELWKCAPKHLKEFVIEYKIKYGCGTFFSLFSDSNIDIIQSILFDCNYTQKKNLIFSDSSMEKCFFLITSNQRNLLEMFIESALVSEDDVNQFKQKLVKERGEDIAMYFIQNKQWNKLEQFEKWALKSDTERKQFRVYLAHSRICRVILISIVEKNNGDFAELERFFKWCNSDDEESVKVLEKEISQKYYVMVLICKLIEENKYECLDQMLNWYFVHDRNQIDQFKRSFYDHKCLKKFYLVVNLIEKDDRLQSFERFVHWCFTSEQEINTFKDSLLHPDPDALSVCMKLLYRSKFKLADEFLNWFFNSSNILINNFKNALVLSRGMEELFDERYDQQQLHDYATEVFKWFNLSLETVEKFIESFRNSEWIEYFLPALNNYVHGQET